MKKPLTIFFIVTGFFAFAQNAQTILSKLKSIPSDTAKCTFLDNAIEAEADPNVWIQYNDELGKITADNLSKAEIKPREFYLKYQANSINNRAYYLQNLGKIEEALKYYRQGLDIRYDIKDKTGVANSLNNLGYLYYLTADYSRALDYYSKGLKVQEEVGDKIGAATSCNNLGTVYEKVGQRQEAIKLINKSIKIREEIKDLKGLAFSYANLATLYEDLNDTSGFLRYQQRALKIRLEQNDLNGIGSSYNNLGYFYLKNREYIKAKEYLEKALEMHLKIQDKESASVSYNNLGLLYLELKNESKAEENFKRALSIAKELGFPDNIYKPAKALYKIYKRRGNYKLALEMNELYESMKDSSQKKENAQVRILLPSPIDSVSGPEPNPETKPKVNSKDEMDDSTPLLYILSGVVLILLIALIFVLRRQNVSRGTFENDL